MKPKSGFLLISAIILIIIIGAASVIISHSFSTSAESSAIHTDNLNAQYLAQAGLQRAADSILNPDSSNVSTCHELSTLYNAVDFEEGQFSTSGVEYISSAAELTEDMSASSTVADVNSTSGYAPSGRITIGGEEIRYSSLSNSERVCGDAPCFAGLTRGLNDTTAKSHDEDAKVTQNMCQVTSTGFIPTEANPEAQHSMMGDIIYEPKADVYIVGRRKGSSYTILEKTGNSWASADIDYSYNTGDDDDDRDATHLLSISGIDPQHLWATGNDLDDEPVLFSRNESGTWQRASEANGQISSNVNPGSYSGISCTDEHDCWAVGYYRRFIHWNGSQWSQSTNYSNVPSTSQLTAVSCASPDDCWAVGTNRFISGSALFVHWNGTNWTRITNTTTPSVNSNVVTNGLMAISCPSTNECWAVGNRRNNTPNVNEFDGTEWKRVTINPSNFNRSFLGVACVTTNDCWAVGGRGGRNNNNRDTIFHYDGTRWNKETLPTSLPYENLYGVGCSTADDCYAVGDDHTVLHWDGSNWSNLSNESTFRSLGSTRLNAVIAFEPPETPSNGRLVDIRDL